MHTYTGTVNTLLRLRVSTGEWEVLDQGESPGSPAPRNEACGAVVGSGLWVFGGSLQADGGGGLAGKGAPGQGRSVNELWRWDLHRGGWEHVRPDPASSSHAPTPRCASGCCADGTTLYIFGGGGIEHRAPSPRLADTWAFDTVARTWRQLAAGDHPGPAPQGRSLPQLAAPQDGRLFLYGGFGEGTRCGDTWVLDLAAGAGWREVCQQGAGHAAPAARSCHGGAVVAVAGGGRRWVITGGRIGYGAAAFGDGAVQTTDAADVWAFDFASCTWHEVQLDPSAGSGPGPCRSHGSTAVAGPGGAGRLIVHGGRNEHDPVLSRVFELVFAPAGTHGPPPETEQ